MGCTWSSEAVVHPQHPGAFSHYEPDDGWFSERTSGMLLSGKWRRMREMLLDCTDLGQFVHILKLSKEQVCQALSYFREIDQTGDGYIDSKEFAKVMGLETNDVMFRYLFNALDVDRSNSVNFKEFLISASHFATEHTADDRSRYCFLILDKDNDGSITFAELESFLVDVTCSTMKDGNITRDSVKTQISKHMEEDLGLDRGVEVSEDKFVELIKRYPRTFSPIWLVYNHLQNRFILITQPQKGVKYSTAHLREYFSKDDNLETPKFKRFAEPVLPPIDEKQEEEKKKPPPPLHISKKDENFDEPALGMLSFKGKYQKPRPVSALPARPTLTAVQPPPAPHYRPGDSSAPPAPARHRAPTAPGETQIQPRPKPIEENEPSQPLPHGLPAKALSEARLMDPSRPVRTPAPIPKRKALEPRWVQSPD